MSTIGQIEKKTQERVVKLFQDTLGYNYLGDWKDRSTNANVESELLRTWLQKQGKEEALISRALYIFEKAVGDTSKTLYDRNRTVYGLIRYGVNVKTEIGENTQTVFLIDWKHPEKNHFAIAEEVTVLAANAKANQKRPDIVLYINGIALGVLELKRSTVSVSEGIRQNLDNQKKEFIEPFFSTIQFLMAGNDTEGLRYASIDTKEKYWLDWKEDSKVANPLDRALIQLGEKSRFLEILHDFIVFDAGTKKLCRQNQYFAVKASQVRIRRREGGIIWNTQGSGKSLIMVWLAKWIRENVTDARVLIITDRTELDEQIEKVFFGVEETIYRTKNGSDLVAKLNANEKWLLCSLVHKFGGKEEGGKSDATSDFLNEIKKLPQGFVAKGDLFVFVDECHRTQSGDLNRAMKAILPNAMFIGFTGTPLLKADKQKSVEVFGTYIHTYKFDEAVRDGVILDLRYEARDIDQNITSQAKIDQWFEAKTKGLTPIAKAQLKQKWGTMQRVLSSQSRLSKIVADIMMDLAMKDRLKSGHGNAILVSGSIYEACKFYELFSKTELKGKCAIVTSYSPAAADIKGEETGEGVTDKQDKYEIYRQMLADWFGEPPEIAVNKAEDFEKAVKKKFINEPGQMKLLIVVDKLLTGFDAPPATYLYIDKQMRDHGLFQAICRVNRLDGDDKDYGYIVDYKDLFKSLEGAVKDYAAEALSGFDKTDVAGLLEDRLVKAREKLETTLEAMRALCEDVAPPKDELAFYRYFSSQDHGNVEQLAANEPQRLSLYTLTAALVRAYANIANEMPEAGFTEAQAKAIKAEVTYFEDLRTQIKLHSGDAIDLKKHEPAMRHLIDTYIQAEDSVKVSAFDDMSLIQLIVERGAGAIEALPEGMRKSEQAVAETIENNVRKLILDENPINPKYYEKMSQLLDALILERKKGAMDYQKYLAQIVELTKQVKKGPLAADYPGSLDTLAKKALFDNLFKNEALALAVDLAVRGNLQDDFRNSAIKLRAAKLLIKNAILDFKNQGATEGGGGTSFSGEDSEAYLATDVDILTNRILELVKNQNEY